MIPMAPTPVARFACLSCDVLGPDERCWCCGGPTIPSTEYQNPTTAYRNPVLRMLAGTGA